MSEKPAVLTIPKRLRSFDKPSELSPREDLGRWLDTLTDWDAWATLTFRTPSPEGAARRIPGWPGSGPSPDRAAYHYRSWITGLGRGAPTPTFYAVEKGRGGRVHLHALLGLGDGSVTRKSLWRSWFTRYGRCQLQRFDPALGATHYITKYLTKSPEHWDIV